MQQQKKMLHILKITEIVGEGQSAEILAGNKKSDRCDVLE